MIRLTKRDQRLLAKCAAAQWLTTAQVQRVFAFPTPNTAQKRLRKLSAAGFIRSIRPNRMAEALHTVGPKGKRLLSQRGIAVELRRKLPSYHDHLIGVNDIRIFFERSGIPVAAYFAFWEIAQFNWNHPIIPDALCTLNVDAPLTLAIEYDRGTERLEKVAKKLMVYAARMAGFPFDAVLVVAETPGRLETLRAHLGMQTIFDGLLGSSIDPIRKGQADAKFFTDLCDAGLEKFSLRDLVALFMRHLNVR